MVVENVYLGPNLTEEALTEMNKDAVGAAKKLKERKRRNAKARPHVMGAYLASHERYGPLYKKLAE